jgi:hypothetical protein
LAHAVSGTRGVGRPHRSSGTVRHCGRAHGRNPNGKNSDTNNDGDNDNRAKRAGDDMGRGR